MQNEYRNSLSCPEAVETRGRKMCKLILHHCHFGDFRLQGLIHRARQPRERRIKRRGRDGERVQNQNAISDKLDPVGNRRGTNLGPESSAAPQHILIHFVCRQGSCCGWVNRWRCGNDRGRVGPPCGRAEQTPGWFFLISKPTSPRIWLQGFSG